MIERAGRPRNAAPGAAGIASERKAAYWVRCMRPRSAAGPRVLICSLLLGVPGFATACARHAKSENSPTAAPAPAPRVETALQVENRSFLDVNIFLLRDGGQRYRIGTVTGLTTHIFMLRPELVLPGSQLQFVIAPIGSLNRPLSEAVIANPGDVITLIVPSDLR